MQEPLMIAVMIAFALVPFAICARFLMKGQVGYAMTLVSIIGAVFFVLMWATNHDMGLDPIKAISWALLLALPALLGGVSGGFMGWLIRWRRERRALK